jgi:o-succinylbenzoate---CoA ligase
VLAGDGDAAGLLDLLHRDRVTIVSVVPTLLARLLDLSTRAGRAAGPPEHLRAVILGGAAASPDLLGRAADAGWPVLTTYGLTEACSQVTTQTYGTVNRGELGAGRPVPGTEVRIAADGEILVRGPTLLSGYVTPDGPEPPSLADGWLRTGDRGRIDHAGNLHVMGRRTDRIITGGENVDPVEVEQALERIPGIRQACVFGEPDAEWGEIVWAAVVPDPGAELDPTHVTELVGPTLATYKRPRRVVILDELPMLGAGKVDRSAVAVLARHRAARPPSGA